MRRVILAIAMAACALCALNALTRTVSASDQRSPEAGPGLPPALIGRMPPLTVTCGPVTVTTDGCRASCSVTDTHISVLSATLEREAAAGLVYTLYPGVEIGPWAIEVCPWETQNGRCVNSTCNTFRARGEGPHAEGEVILRGFDWGGQGRLRLGTLVTLPVGGWPQCEQIRVVASRWLRSDPPIPTCRGEGDMEMGGYDHGFFEVGCARGGNGYCWWYRPGALHVAFDVVAYPVGVGECGVACRSTESGHGSFGVVCSMGTLSGTWFVTSTLVETETEPCIVTQTLLFDDNDGAVGTEITPTVDIEPLGLYPFDNGRYVSRSELVSLVLTYALAYTGTEIHTVDWRAITFTVPFTVPDCLEPVLTDRCPEPDWPIWALGDWLAWLWCKLLAWLRYIVTWLAYIACLIHRIIAILANALFRFVYEITTDAGDFFTDTANDVFGFFEQLAEFLEMVFAELGEWVTDASATIGDHISGRSIEIARALNRYFRELSSWTRDTSREIGDAISGTSLEIGRFIRNGSSEIADWIRDTSREIARYLARFNNELTDLLAMLVVVIGDWIADYVEGVADLVSLWVIATGAFLDTVVTETGAWLADLLDWIGDTLSVWIVAVGVFLDMAVTETGAALGAALTEFGRFLSRIVLEIGRFAAAVVLLAGSVTELMAGLFETTVGTLIAQVRAALGLARFVYDLAGGLIVGTRSALDSNDVADIWGPGLEMVTVGLQFFDDAVGSTPLAALNAVAMGVMALGLVSWTMSEIRSLVNMLMQI